MNTTIIEKVRQHTGQEVRQVAVTKEEQQVLLLDWWEWGDISYVPDEKYIVYTYSVLLGNQGWNEYIDRVEKNKIL